MNIIGIIAEYNPFHNGHAYQIEEIKNQTNADYVVVACSGNFVQRGAPAIVNKFERTKMALNYADCVFEIPTLFACASAEYFASAAAILLAKAGATTLCFGAETDDLASLEKIADILLSEPADYQSKLKEGLKLGLSFPKARNQALTELYHFDATLLDLPNNILAIEYLKAIKKYNLPLTPYLLKRIANQYHDLNLQSNISSASSIRQALKEKRNEAFASLPDSSKELLDSYWKADAFLFEDDFSLLLGQKILEIHDKEDSFFQYADCSSELENRIKKSLPQYLTASDFISTLKTKELTYTRISRVLFHILLDLKSSDYDYWRQNGFIPYLRVLGFKKNSESYISFLKEHSDVPIILQIAKDQKQLKEDALSLLKKDLFATNLYHLVLSSKTKKVEPNDFGRPIIVKL